MAALKELTLGWDVALAFLSRTPKMAKSRGLKLGAEEGHNFFSQKVMFIGHTFASLKPPGG